MHSLTEENYFSEENNMKYVGSSQIKSFYDCEARTMEELKGEWQRPQNNSLLVGSFVDASVSGTLDEFTKQHPEIFKKDGTLKSEYIQATYILERIQKDEMFNKYLSGDHQTIMTGEIENIPVKIKIDAYHKDKAIVDLKCVRYEVFIGVSALSFLIFLFIIISFIFLPLLTLFSFKSVFSNLFKKFFFLFVKCKLFLYPVFTLLKEFSVFILSLSSCINSEVLNLCLDISFNPI